MPPAALFRVGGDGAAERVLARGVRHPRYQVNTAGETSKLPTRRPARPILHPTRGHVGQNAPQRVMDRLSVSEDPEGTVGRFARATRRQNVEFHATVHPLSGRMMSLARGHEIGVATGLQSAMGSTTRRRLMAFGERHSADRPELADRAANALMRQGTLAGPRPIVVHNHPTFPGGGTRHLPSAGDTTPLVDPAMRQQNRVISLEPHAGRGQPKTHETTFGVHHSTRADHATAQIARHADIDAQTVPPGLLQRLRDGGPGQLPLLRRMHGMTRAEAATSTRKGNRAHAEAAMYQRGTYPGYPRRPNARLQTARRAVPIGASHDQLLRDLTQPGRREMSRRDFAREGGLYIREQVRKSIATDKAAGAFLHAARHPGYLLRAHPAGVATAGVGAAAAAAPHHTDRGRKLRDTATGAVAGKAGYQLVGHGAKAAARRSVQWHARMSDLPSDTEAQRARKSQIKHEQKMRGRWQRSHGNHVGGADYRDFPLGRTLGDGGGHGGEFVPHRRARVFRALGHTHGGRSGVALSTAVSAATAAAGYRHATRVHSDRVDVGRSDIVKAAWGYQENRVIPVRAAEWSAGAALLAYGLPRLAMTGKLLDAGVKSVAQRSGEESALKFANRATRVRSLVHRGTQPIERLRGIEQIDHAIAIIPASLRPVAAVALGAALMSHSHPIRKPEFVPVGGNQ